MERKKALLFIFDGFCEFEISTAISMLRSTHDLHTFAVERTPCKSEAGLTTVPDFSIEELTVDEYEVLLIPGGDLQPIADKDELFDYVKMFAVSGKLVGAICSGVYVLAKAGVLHNRSYTVTLSKEQRDFLGCFEETSNVYVPIVMADNIITAQGHAYVEFGIEINKQIKQVSDGTIEFYQGKRNRMMES